LAIAHFVAVLVEVWSGVRI